MANGAPTARMMVGCDFTLTSEAAVDLAAVVAGQLGMPLTVIHVLPLGPEIPPAHLRPGHGREMPVGAELDLERELRAGDRQRAGARRADAERRLLALTPDGARAILDDGDAQERLKAHVGPGDLLALGTGRLASRLARDAEVPLLVVPQGSRPQLHSVLVGTDFSPAAEAALRWSETLARAGVTRALGHVAHRREQADARARLEARAARAYLDFHLAVGSEADGLLELAHRAGADALVLGLKRRPAMIDALLGSATRSLLRRARIPLWLVPLPPA